MEANCFHQDYREAAGTEDPCKDRLALPILHARRPTQRWIGGSLGGVPPRWQCVGPGMPAPVHAAPLRLIVMPLQSSPARTFDMYFRAQSLDLRTIFRSFLLA